MPIRPENRARYPRDWKAISASIRFERAAGWCEFCRDAEHGQLHPRTGSIVVLTVAHLDHVPENCDPANLAAMCQLCHNTYDGPYRRRGIRERAHEAAAIGDLLTP